MVVTVSTDEGLVLFGQDVHGPFDPAFGSDTSVWAASMKELIKLEADILCEGHFGVFRPKSGVRAFIEGICLARGYQTRPSG